MAVYSKKARNRGPWRPGSAERTPPARHRQKCTNPAETAAAARVTISGQIRRFSVGPTMILLSSNKPQRLLLLTYIGRVHPRDFERALADLPLLLANLPEGFRLLTDFTQLESMDIGCTAGLGRLMELVDQAGIGQLIRVIPDPMKDIGVNILAQFHYRRLPPVVTCASLAEAAEILGR